MNPNLKALEIHYNHQVDFAEQFGIIVPESYNEVDLASILHTDQQEFSPICYAVIGKAHFLEGDLIAALKYFRKAHTLALTSKDAKNPDIIVYTKYELGAFWAALESADLAYQYLLEARLLTSDENLRALIDCEIAYNSLSQDLNYPVSQIDAAIKGLQTKGLELASSFFHLKLGEYFINNKEFDKALHHLDHAKKTAATTNYEYLKQRIQLATSFTNMAADCKETNTKRKDQIKTQVESPFLRTLHSELSARAHLLNKENELAVNDLYEALTVSLEYRIIEKRIAQSLFLGKIKSEYVNAPNEAYYHYQTAFSLTCELLENGLPLKGIRQRALNEYMDFVKTPALTDQLSKSTDDVFDFANGKTWLELTDIFKFNLIVYHRQLNRKLRAMLAKIDLTQASFNSKQVLLKKRGFVLPNMKYKKITYDDPNYSQDLQDYIGRLKDKTWPGGIKHFEKEIMQYLYAKNNYNKTHLSKVLGFSYSHTLLKMNALEIPSYQPGGDLN